MKICQQINLISSLFAVIFFAGCRQFGTTINDPSRIIEVKAKKAGSCEVVTIPHAQNDPGQAEKAVAKKESDRNPLHSSCRDPQQGKLFVLKMTTLPLFPKFLLSFSKKSLTNKMHSVIIVRHSKYGAMAKW